MSKSMRYFLLSACYWVIVDFTTAFCPDVQRWVAHMPLVWLFYLGFPALFSLLIYRLDWRKKRLFIAMLVELVLVELIFSHNVLLVTFPILLVMIPLALAIYSFITYVPLWIVEGEVKQHRNWIVFLAAVWLVVAVLNTLTTIRSM